MGSYNSRTSIIILTVGKYVIVLLIILNIAMHQFHCELICKYC